MSSSIKYVLSDGFSVIPVGGDKRPLLKSWKRYQTSSPTEAELKSWERRWPGHNVAVVTGKVSGITVVDVDEGGDASKFPRTYTVRTPNGGYHLYYAYHPGLTVSARAYPHLPNVDVRSDGGYVVAPPSVLADGGRYEVVEGGAFAPFPAHLFDGAEVSPSKPVKDLLAVREGSRNQSMASLVGSLVHGQTREYIQALYPVVESLNMRYSPPLPPRELKSVFKSIAGRELDRQRAEAERIEIAVPSPIQRGDLPLRLRVNGSNAPYRDMANVLIAFEAHPRIRGTIRYDEFLRNIVIEGREMRNDDVARLTSLVQESVLPGVGSSVVREAVVECARRNSFDSLTEWLDSLEWDGTPRLASWLSRALGVAESPYLSGVGAQWISAAVRRAYRPGSAFDSILVLIGDQGVGKTSLLRIIGGQWYKQWSGGVDSKDFYLSLRGGLVVDLDEGLALSRSDAVKVKSVISATFDEYRPPYGVTTERHPRRFVFGMTTNDPEPLRDATGNRRYWIVDVPSRVDFEWLSASRDQLFAEAVRALKGDVRLPEVPAGDALDRQDDRMADDEWTDPVERWLMARPGYAAGDPDFSVSVGEVYLDALKGPSIDRLDRRQEMRIGVLLRRTFGFERRRSASDGVRKYRYYLTPSAADRMGKIHRKGAIIPDDFQFS